MRNVALRDMIRSSPLGPLIRSTVVKGYRRHLRLNEANRLLSSDLNRFHCPICNYDGIFVDKRSADKTKETLRKYSACPECGGAERHRLQVLVLNDLLHHMLCKDKSVLHFAPEEFLSRRLKHSFGTYQSIDLFRRDVDVRADITELPHESGTFDLIYASHVLEHVPDDKRALSEISRVLKPGGIAILPVPIYCKDNIPCENTIEYGRAIQHEDGHVRAPGMDYFDRYKSIFSQVYIRSSSDFGTLGTSNQLYIRPPCLNVAGDFACIPDFVPICQKSKD